NPGLLCAWGAVGAPLGREYSLTVREAEPKLRRLTARAKPMLTRARAELISDGAAPSAIQHELWADMRYRGQSYEIEIKLGPDFISEFHEAHRRTFGHAAAQATVEVVNLRLRAHARGPAPMPSKLARNHSSQILKRSSVMVGTTLRDVPVYARESIGSSARLNGPLVVVELSATAYVAPEFTLRCDDYGNLHLEMR
ncbi:MAG: hypothetical protein ACREQ4_16630, partial [Candidatus Binataceae bacterium]